PPVERHLVDETHLHCGAEREQHVFFFHPGRRSEHLEIELTTDDRSHPQHVVCVGAEPAESTADHLADALRQADRVGWDRGCPAALALDEHTGLGEMTQHLADEERIALGLVANDASEVASAATLLLPGR